MKTIVKSLDVIFMLSNISAFLEEGISTCQQDIFVWTTDKGEIMLLANKKELHFIDWTSDRKTTSAIIGLAFSIGYTTADYFTK